MKVWMWKKPHVHTYQKQGVLVSSTIGDNVPIHLILSDHPKNSVSRKCCSARVWICVGEAIGTSALLLVSHSWKHHLPHTARGAPGKPFCLHTATSSSLFILLWNEFLLQDSSLKQPSGITQGSSIQLKRAVPACTGKEAASLHSLGITDISTAAAHRMYLF